MKVKPGIMDFGQFAKLLAVLGTIIFCIGMVTIGVKGQAAKDALEHVFLGCVTYTQQNLGAPPAAAPEICLQVINEWHELGSDPPATPVLDLPGPASIAAH